MLQILDYILSCRNICLRIKKFSAPRYKLGLKFCRLCEAAFDTTKKICECCGTWLRTKRHAWDKRGELSRLDKRIKLREQGRTYFKRWYDKHHNTPEFRLKYNEKKRKHYSRNAPKIRAKVKERWHLKQCCLNAIT
jgi:hypothetical protein